MATPPVFSAGSVLTAGQMNAVGLWKITPSSATNGTVSNGAVTIGNAVSSVTVNGVFSADFDAYQIIISGGTASGGFGIDLQLGSTTTGYYNAGYNVTFAGSANISNNNNGAAFTAAGIATTNTLSANIFLNGPYLSKHTYFTSSYIFGDTGGSHMANGGFLNNSTSYTSFKIQIGGTMTGGTIRVYGYRV